MRLIYLLGGAVAGGVLLAVLADDARAAVALPSIEDYPEHPAGPWGPVWRQQRPFGLPAGARFCSDEGAALPHIRRLAAPDGAAFSKLVEHLAITESEAMLGRAANTFDIRPPQERPAGKVLITAWGCFQWNRGAIANAGHMAPIGIPGFSSRVSGAWEWTPDEELALPMMMYRQIWRYVRERRGSELDAARAVRLWHRTSTGGRQYLESGARTLWPLAWAAVSADHRTIVDRHLTAARVV